MSSSVKDDLQSLEHLRSKCGISGVWLGREMDGALTDQDTMSNSNSTGYVCRNFRILNCELL